jgi:hypothetical protein
VVVIQDPEGVSSRSGKRVIRLVQEIVSFAVKENLKVIQYSRDQIREVFEQFRAVTKYEIS